MKNSTLSPFVKHIKDSLRTMKSVEMSKKRTLDSYSLNAKLKGMKVADALYHLNKASNLPTLELQDALMTVLRYHAPAADMKPDHLVWGIDDSQEIVILYRGVQIAKPQMTKDGALEINFTDSKIKLPNFSSASELSPAEATVQITDAVKQLTEKGYAEVNVKGLNAQFYKIRDDEYGAIFNGSSVVEVPVCSEPAITEMVSSPSSCEVVAGMSLTPRIVNEDQALIDLAKNICVELKALKCELKARLYNDPLHAGLDEYLYFYRSYLNFGLFVKSMAGDSQFAECGNVGDWAQFTQGLKAKIDTLIQTTGPHRGLNQAACDLSYLPVFKYCA